MDDIYKHTYKITIFAPRELGPVDLATIDYLMSDGDCVGDVELVSVEEREHGYLLRDELLAIGNDGTFFDTEDFEDEE